MGSNTFGQIFRVTTWGESHGEAIGVVIDGCPAGIELSEEDVNQELALRRPGGNPYVSPRGEKDQAKIYSGVFEGKTTGAPISIIIFNHDRDSSKYEPIKHLLRPGHAHFTYLEKYGIFDYRGGGRSSARETACRVAAGAVAKKLLSGIELAVYIKEIGGIQSTPPQEVGELKKETRENPIFCPDKAASQLMMAKILQVKEAGDSLGGIIEAQVYSLPTGLGDPVYEKLEANLAKAMLSIPASKGFEIGAGFEAARMLGSKHNDLFINDRGETLTNHAGGVLGGISTGMPLVFRVAFKPPSSINQPQQTVSVEGEVKELSLPPGSRHDPCVAIRAVPVVEAMTALVLADALLINHCQKSDRCSFPC